MTWKDYICDECGAEVDQIQHLKGEDNSLTMGPWLFCCPDHLVAFDRKQPRNKGPLCIDMKTGEVC